MVGIVRVKDQEHPAQVLEELSYCRRTRICSYAFMEFGHVFIFISASSEMLLTYVDSICSQSDARTSCQASHFSNLVANVLVGLLLQQRRHRIAILGTAFGTPACSS